MARKVVDASAIAAVLFDEPNAGKVIDRLATARLVAPSLLSYELANVCVVKSRREPERAHDYAAALTHRRRLGIEELPVDSDVACVLALETRLTAYDANYLWLALDLDAELVTLDDALARAWSAKAG